MQGVDLVGTLGLLAPAPRAKATNCSRARS